jgi:hypothetical protein
MREEELFKAPPVICRQSIGAAPGAYYSRKRSVLRSGSGLDRLRMSKQGVTLREAPSLAKHFLLVTIFI